MTSPSFFERLKLEPLRDGFRARGQRPSIAFIAAAPASQSAADLAEALRIVEAWGPFVEAMYLMMAADRRVLNVEREVLRGALAVLSGDSVRTRHMEAMLDAASRNVSAEGVEARLAHVIGALRADKTRAENAVVVAAAIAAADQRVAPEEHALLQRLISELGIREERAAEILADLEASVR